MFRRVAYRACFIGCVVACGAAGAACSSSDDNRGGAGAAAGGASGGGAGGAGGVAGAGAGSGGTAGLAGSGAGAMGPYQCAKGNKANCDNWTSFSQATTTSWGSLLFQGGVTTFGPKLVRDSSTSAIHVSGTVDNYGYGFGLFFLNCSDLSAYTGVSFKLSGMAGTQNMMIFQVQTNPDYPWQAMPMDKKGGCTAAVATDPFGTCVAPSKTLPIADSTVLWADLGGGKPTMTASPDQALGLQWALPYDGKTSYPFDITVSDVKLIGGTGSSVSCDSAAAGGSGSGGASAGSGGAAGASAGSAGSAGPSAGSGGTGG